LRDNGGGLIVNLGSMHEIPEGLNGMGGKITEDNPARRGLPHEQWWRSWRCRR